VQRLVDLAVYPEMVKQYRKLTGDSYYGSFLGVLLATMFSDLLPVAS
jgi:hypothetical protein